MDYQLSHLKELESEAIYVLREVAAQFQNPVILFSGGKDSILVSYLAVKAFYPARVPFALLHIDTGHNFEETIQFRDDLVAKYDLKLVVGSVEDAIRSGKLREETGIGASRNYLQTHVLLESIESGQYDAAIGGGRRDADGIGVAREPDVIEGVTLGEDVAQDRSSGNGFEGDGTELWNLFNGRKGMGEHFRVFPISNWTELDVWQYIEMENIPLPSLYFAHKRKVFERDGMLLADSPYVPRAESEPLLEMTVRCRTIGDISCTGLWRSEANSISEIIEEVAVARVTERGGRADDKRSETAMEDRKKEGYF